MAKKIEKMSVAQEAQPKETNKKEEVRYGDLLKHKKNYRELCDESVKISTGSLTADLFLDGGYTCGVARFLGPEEHGKTLQSLNWAAEWLKRYGDKGRVVYFDAEGRLTSWKFQQSPISKIPDVEKLFQCLTYNVIEHIGNYMVDLLTDNADGLHYFFVLDSLDMVRSTEDDGRILGDDGKMAAVAKLMKELYRRICYLLISQEHHFHVLSQISSAIEKQTFSRAINNLKVHAGGGTATKHANVLFGEIQQRWPKDMIYENPDANFDEGETKGKPLGHKMTIKFLKTPNDQSNQTIVIPIKRGTSGGIWRELEVYNILLMYNLLEKSGSWFKLNDDFAKAMSEKYSKDFNIKIQGAVAMREYLEKNQEITDILEKEIRSTIISKLPSEIKKD